MKSGNFSYQLRTLVQLEQRNRLDYTDRLETVYQARIRTIDNMSVDEKQKQRLIAQAHMQYQNFTNRTPPLV